MAEFKKTTLAANKRICFRLKDARIAKAMSIKDIAKHTRISPDYIEAIEACKFDTLPSATIYQKHFIKSYCEAVGLDPKPFVEQFLDEEITPKEAMASTKTKRVPKLFQFANIPFAAKMIGLGIIVLGGLVYLGAQVKHIIEPPELVIYSPSDGMISTESNVVVEGKTEKEVTVTVNGKSIRNSEDGIFSESIAVNPGVNTIVITAKKKHGKETAETRHVILKDHKQISFKE